MYVLCSPMELHVAQCLMGVAWKLLTGQLDLQQDAPRGTQGESHWWSSPGQHSLLLKQHRSCVATAAVAECAFSHARFTVVDLMHVASDASSQHVHKLE